MFLNRKHSEKTKEKLSQQKLGDKNPMFGKTGDKHPNYNKKFSEESRSKMSKSHINIPTGRNGSKSPMSKITETDVLEIRKFYSNNILNQRELSEKYVITQSAINLIINRKRWTHI